MTLTFDIEGQIFKWPYLWNGGTDSIVCWTHYATQTLNVTHELGLEFIFKIQFSNSHISGIGDSSDLKRQGCECDTMSDPLWKLGLEIWDCPWAGAHTTYIGDVTGLGKTVTVSNLHAH